MAQETGVETVEGRGPGPDHRPLISLEMYVNVLPQRAIVLLTQETCFFEGILSDTRKVPLGGALSSL